jgi:arylesterase/paraoxonase
VKPFRRILVTAGAVVLVGAAGLVGRTLVMGGAFDEVRPVARDCKALTGVTGAEDMALDTKDRLLFLSATDRRAFAQGRASAGDGIYVLSLDHPDAGIRKLAGTPKIFHPHGISLFRGTDGALTLMAVNHLSMTEHAVDIFQLAKDGSALNEIGAIESDKLIHPNDVAAVGPAQFYVTNDHGSTTALGMQVESYLLLPRADVLYYDGMVFKEVAKGLVFANGINLSNDGGHVYVAESTARRIQTFARDPFSGRLVQENAFDFPAGPDNIDVDARGDLWIAGHPKMFALVGYASDPAKPSPTEIFRVTTKGGIPQAAEPVYVDTGRQLGAGSVGVAADKTLYIGSIFDAKILACGLP